LLAFLEIAGFYPTGGIHIPACTPACAQEDNDVGITPVPQSEIKSIRTKDGSTRNYVVHLPSSWAGESLPAVLLFHGGGGPLTSAQKVTKFSGITRFNALADKERFLVVYPMADGPHWNDARPEMPRSNDLEFVDSLISELVKDFHVNPSQIYACGMSNGAFFTNYIGLTLSDKIAAIASVCGPIPTVDATLQIVKPVSALLIDGTADPKVPFGGGGINRGVSGETLSHEESVARWIHLNGGIKKTLVESTIPGPRLTVKETLWETKTGALVGSVALEGGGHQWCHLSNFDTTIFVWQFFKTQASRRPGVNLLLP
jgi:polyhydroxybutyrate depolymerase